MKDYITFLRFDDLTPNELLEHYEEDIERHNKVITETPNLDGLRIAYKDEFVRRSINSADYSTIDGTPILWLAKLTHKKQFKYKISGSDLVPMVLKLANEKKYSVVLFGGKNGVAEEAKKNIEKDYPNVRVTGTICPDFGFEKSKEKSMSYINQINSAKADIILLCVGFPKSERFFFENYDSFGPGAYFNVGATIDFLAKSIKRAPKWMSKVGLEWLYRLSKDFCRLFKRYWLDFWFLVKVIFILSFNKKVFIKMRNEDSKHESCH